MLANEEETGAIAGYEGRRTQLPTGSTTCSANAFGWTPFGARDPLSNTDDPPAVTLRNRTRDFCAALRDWPEALQPTRTATTPQGGDQPKHGPVGVQLPGVGGGT